MKFVILSLATLFACNVFAAEMPYNERRAIMLVDAQSLDQKELLALGMDRYRIISSTENAKAYSVVVGIMGPGGECTSVVSFMMDGSIYISRAKCQPGT